MRPRRIRRGTVPPAHAPVLDRQHASMRPRRIRRGTRSSPRTARALHRCFNEAPANSPGNASLRSSTARVRPCFNEAPANSPGNGAGRTAPGPPGSGFNEAPANSPGNGHLCRREVRRRRAASMRPRRIRREPPWTALPRPPPLMASMRPRRIRRGTPSSRTMTGTGTDSFNEAPANSPGNASSWSWTRRPIRRRFNEAPANSPGNDVSTVSATTLRARLQ